MSQYDDLDPRDDPEGRDLPRRGERLREGRGTTVLVLGILGLVVCVICGIIAWSMGASDLKEMRAGRMDRRQESETRIGMILGIVSVVLNVLAILLMILMFVGVFAIGSKMVDETKPGGFFDRMASTFDKNMARAEMAQIASAIDAYQVSTGKLPATLGELTLKGDAVPTPLTAPTLQDPWNHEYEYEPQGAMRYRLYSMGPDGQSGTNDDLQHEKPER